MKFDGYDTELARVLDDVAPIYHYRRQANEAEKESAPRIERVKQWMALNFDALDRDERGRAYIVDGEHSLRAILSERASTDWDVAHMPPVVINWLHAHGLLTVNTRAFDALKATETEYDLAKTYRLTGSTYALIVEENK